MMIIRSTTTSLYYKCCQPSGILIHEENLYAPHRQQSTGCCELLNKLKILPVVAELIKTFSDFCCAQRSLPYSQEYAIGPYFELDESISSCPIYLKDAF
jgi:hypothetical protein